MLLAYKGEFINELFKSFIYLIYFLIDKNYEFF